jgi:hypothetical protein
MTHDKLWFGLLGCAALALPLFAFQGTAQAYCRTTTEPRPAGRCPEECITDGLPLYWGDLEPFFHFNDRFFPDLSEDEARQIMGRSFDHWNEVECATENGPVTTGLDIVGAQSTTSLEVGPVDEEPNENVIVFFSADEWIEQDLNDSAYALTAIWFNRLNGEILGADMHFNGGMGRFVECPASGCAQGDVDLENVATHEAGHFVGLAHSDVQGSTMWCSAEPTETENRSLSADDIAGVCAIYTPHEEKKKGCSLGGNAGALGALPLLGALALLRRRRQRG